jgi:hypothetical protein
MDTDLIDTLREQLSAAQTQLKEQQLMTAQLISERKERDGHRPSSRDDNHSYGDIVEVISEQKRGIILDRLSGIQRILQVISTTLDLSLSLHLSLSLCPSECCEVF